MSVFGYEIMFPPDWISSGNPQTPCPDCSDLRALLGERDEEFRDTNVDAAGSAQ